MSLAKPAQFRDIPLTDLIRQINGPEIREQVYDFGRQKKRQGIELPGQTYEWARDIPVPTETNNNG